MGRATSLVGILAAAVGCEAEPRPGSWTLRFADPTHAARAELIEVGIERGGCGSAIDVYEDQIREGYETMRPPRLPPGTYGFQARARDSSCVWFAFGCQERTLPSDDAEIVVVLTAAPEEAACDPSACVDGRCEGADAGPIDAGAIDGGPPRDVGPPQDDAGHSDAGRPPDAGPADSGPPDSGPPDAGPTMVPGLVAHWDCDDSLADGNMRDLTGRGHGAMCTPGTTCPTQVPGHDGLACSFSSGLYLGARDHADFRTPEFTIMLWFNARVLDGALFSKPVGTGSSNTWQFEIRDPSATFTTGTLSDSRLFLDSSVSVTTGRWYHLAGTYDGTTKRLYLDGVLVGTQAHPGIEWDGHDVIIGADSNTGAIVLGFPGALDDLRVYDRALSVTEVRSIIGM